MIRQTLTYEDYQQGEDVTVTVEVRFAYTPPAIRLYEQHNPGAKFFVDLNKATEAYSRYIKADNFSELAKGNNSLAQSADMLTMLTDPDINEFMLRVIPCLYMETHGGLRLQSEETWTEANDSLWMMQLVSVNFFSEVFSELNSLAFAQSKSRVKKNEVKKQSTQ